MDSLEAELVGSLLQDAGAYYALPPAFSAACLRNPVARQTFEAIERLALGSTKPLSGDVPVSLLGLAPGATEEVAKAKVTGVPRWARGMGAALVRNHRADLLAEQFRAAAKDLENSGRLDEVTERVLAALVADPPASAPVTYADAGKALEREAHATKTGEGRLRTGFPSIDRLVSIRPGHLVILASRAGCGKSTLALNIAENVALPGRRILIHSLEMTASELRARSEGRFAGLSSREIADGEASAPAEVKAQIDRLRIEVNFRAYGLPEIVRLTEHAHRREALALVVVDYLQLVEVAQANRSGTREQEVAKVTRALKTMAQRLGVPVLALSQLNRAIETSSSSTAAQLRGPRLSDLRESGAIEQDANVVAFLHNPSAAPARRPEHFKFIVAKQRAGGLGEVLLRTALLAHSSFLEEA